MSKEQMLQELRNIKDAGTRKYNLRVYGVEYPMNYSEPMKSVLAEWVRQVGHRDR